MSTAKVNAYGYSIYISFPGIIYWRIVKIYTWNKTIAVFNQQRNSYNTYTYNSNIKLEIAR